MVTGINDTIDEMGGDNAMGETSGVLRTRSSSSSSSTVIILMFGRSGIFKDLGSKAVAPMASLKPLFFCSFSSLVGEGPRPGSSQRGERRGGGDCGMWRPFCSSTAARQQQNETFSNYPAERAQKLLTERNGGNKYCTLTFFCMFNDLSYCFL